ncbi:hypothetical protein R1flu_002016 [Riccia fluitans]|uniref:SS18 N-terminal domain-containing protein n=1 Tax=Riccia fluitans TaxID=41844 RepID=A0ABD1Y5B8_9MARC
MTYTARDRAHRSALSAWCSRVYSRGGRAPGSIPSVELAWEAEKRRRWWLVWGSVDCEWMRETYLDENKQLILAILDNQNLGKLQECATYQAKLQQNLMYLAAIADAQPQGPQPSSQAVASNAMPAAQQQYMQQQQMTHQSILGQRGGSAQYMGQGQSAPHQSGQQQQALHSQQGMMSGGNTGLHIMSGGQPVSRPEEVL